MITYNKGIQVRLQNKRGLFYKYMVDILHRDRRICYLSCDTIMEGSNMRKAMDQYPNRIIDVGIAEQNAVDIAVGLALSGKIPYVTTVSSFLALKTLEQIHTNIAYCDIPVRLIASNSGTTAGPTHDAICDIGIMNSIPNMTIIAPSCTKHLIQAIDRTIEYPKPIYYKMPQYHDEDIDQNYKDFTFEIGKSITISEGGDATVIGIGAGVSYGMQAAKELVKDNIKIRVIDMLTVKPIDREAIIKAAKETGLIVTVEDQNIQNGLGCIVSDVLIEAGLYCKTIKLGIPDEFSKTGELYSAYYGYDDNGIVEKIKEALNSKQ